MKALIFSTLFFSLSLFAQGKKGPQFSAFTANNILYVTVLSDDCNVLNGELVVSDNCRADRLIQNFAPVCGATLEISSTRKACATQQGVPRIISINLEETRIAPESDVLVLTYDRTTIPVTLNK